MIRKGTFLSIVSLITIAHTAYAGTPRISRETFREEVSQFVSRHYPSSPLARVDLQDAFYDAGEKNNLDPRFLVAMSTQETALYTDGCAVRHGNNNMFNWFWNPTSARCKDSRYDSYTAGANDVAIGLRRWIKKLDKISTTFNAYDFVLNRGRRYCTVDCEDCMEVDDSICRMSSNVITEEVADQCNAKLGTCLNPCIASDGCDPGCRCWSPNIAVFMEELGGDPCNIWFDSASPASVERACKPHIPPPPPECSIIAIQRQVNFGAIPMESCTYQTVVVQNQSTCDTLTGNITITPPFRLMASPELNLKKSETRSILVEYCALQGGSVGTLTLSTNRGNASSILTANGCEYETLEMCSNDIDDNCDNVIDESDPRCGPMVCGDGAQQENEPCEDGNLANGDCCSSVCTPEDPNSCTPPPLVIQPSHRKGVDVWITSMYSYDDNYGVDNTVLQVGGFGDQYYSLIRFNTSQAPLHTTSAVVYLYAIPRGDTSSPIGMYVDRVTSWWDESVGWNEAPSAVLLNSLPTPMRNEWYAIDITDTYNCWQSGECPNYGIQLRPTKVFNNFNVFYSSDYMENPSLRPKLVITR
ncbi:MAG: DNRLRE domain-containing protein [Patescibacteria group bacterium]|jgi:cysteine-rich repeat protein